MTMRGIAINTAAVALLALGLRTVQTPVTPKSQAATEIVIYSGTLSPGWQNWSWASHDLSASKPGYRGGVCVRMNPKEFQGVYFHHDGIDTSGYSALSFWVHGGATGGQKIVVALADSKKVIGPKVEVGKRTTSGSVAANQWQLVLIPLSALRGNDTRVTGVCFQDALQVAQSSLYLADIRIVGAKPRPSGPLTFEIDVSKDVRPISPLIYGLASAPESVAKDLRATLNRWGGNQSTRYNWELGNAWNHGNDYQFRNTTYGADSPEQMRPSGVADLHIQGSKRLGMAAYVSIPTLGWVARDRNGETRSVNVPGKVKNWGIPVSSVGVSGYDPTENRTRTSLTSVPRKRATFIFPPDLADSTVFQDEWVHHLVSRFGSAERGGVQYYAMDNEPDLWDHTHLDVHPIAMTYDMLLSRFLEYASAIKDVDRTASVGGPVSWGWTGYFHSPRDQGNFGARPDRMAHGDTPFIPWFLSEVQKHDKRRGYRSLNVLDIHYYPQGNQIHSDVLSPSVDAARIRSTRTLWDPNYTDESWIGEPVRLIPRMREWIAKHYPGTKLGIMEWNFGGETGMSGAIALAESLAIMGREGVDLAAYWMFPKPGSPAYLAWKLLRNPDGRGKGFGGTSVRASTSNAEDTGVYASLDDDGLPVILMTNRRLDKPVEAKLVVKGTVPTELSGFELAEIDPGTIHPLRKQKFKSGDMVMLPPRSITLIRLAR